ncbi:MAG: SMI1/KNR4 family protein [Gammaproteobacteria bacterium]
MTRGDIQRLERALAVTLPLCYTDLLLRYPLALEENGFHFGDGFEPLSKRFLVKDIDRLIELNETVSAAGERLTDEVPWPAHLFAIGENAGGDYYLLELGSEAGRVLFFNRQIGTLNPCARTLEGFIERILRQAEEFNFWHSPALNASREAKAANLS